MSKWTHRICERCWFDGKPVEHEGCLFYGGYEPILGVMVGGAYRQPTQLKDIEAGACCFCGGMTVTAIFVREDPGTLRCQGHHDDVASWSRVGVGPAPEVKT